VVPVMARLFLPWVPGTSPGHETPAEAEVARA
jgi:hypothetical protein